MTCEGRTEEIICARKNVVGLDTDLESTKTTFNFSDARPSPRLHKAMRWFHIHGLTRKRAHASSVALAPHLELGRRGEELAADVLRRAGYKLVAANFKLTVGRNMRGAPVQAEIDIVAYEGATLCFVEVKTRRSDWYASPEANVDLRKQRQVSRAARAYRRLFGLACAPTRYDVVSVILPAPDETGHAPAPHVELLRNFWTDAKFNKRRWTE
ncbi:MAG: YraN family protein [Pyrinomonadaceae bacterium]